MYQMVFSDLTEKGFLVTRGLKYGADFLAYEGDPTTCHARYMVHVVDAKSGENSDAAETATISMQTLIRCERLANSVKKDLLIAYRQPS